MVGRGRLCGDGWGGGRVGWGEGYWMDGWGHVVGRRLFGGEAAWDLEGGLGGGAVCGGEGLCGRVNEFRLGRRWFG